MYIHFCLSKCGVSRNEDPSTAYEPTFYCRILFYSQNGDVCKKVELNMLRIDQDMRVLRLKKKQFPNFPFSPLLTKNTIHQSYIFQTPSIQFVDIILKFLLHFFFTPSSQLVDTSPTTCRHLHDTVQTPEENLKHHIPTISHFMSFLIRISTSYNRLTEYN